MKKLLYPALCAGLLFSLPAIAQGPAPRDDDAPPVTPAPTPTVIVPVPAPPARPKPTATATTPPALPPPTPSPPVAAPAPATPAVTPASTASVESTPAPEVAALPTAATPATLATGPTAAEYAATQQGMTLRANTFAEERTPPGTTGPGAVTNDIQFAMHGYFRAPFRLSWKRRGQTKPDESKYDLRTPFLVDDDYYRSGFGYTPLSEGDYSELFLMAGNKHLTGTVALMGSLYSDPARPLIDRQMGIAQGYLTYRFNPDLVPGVKMRVKVKGGAFWDRFGYLPQYDTYIFGRTHQMGEQIRVDADVNKFTFSLLHGVGAHLEAIDANQGLSILNYLRAGASYDRTAEVGLYYLRTWTQDKRQLKELTDANLRVMGMDARVDSHGFGKMYVAGSVIKADQATYLSPSIEVMHSFGGRGITENYLGTQKSNNGDGRLYNLGFQYDYSLAAFMKRMSPESGDLLGGGDVSLSIFGLYTFVESKQQDVDPAVNRDERKYFKYGTELAWWALPWIGASLRYDRVVLNVDDSANTYRILSPRVSLRTTWMEGGQIYLQWSRYSYGERVKLRPGQVALETQPDDNVVKIQAQFAF